jgi:hypothetical protein
MPESEVLKVRGRYEIEDELRTALEYARAEYKKASMEFDLLVRQPPRDIPSPDGQFRAEQIRRQHRMAFEHYRKALKEFADFVLGR